MSKEIEKFKGGLINNSSIIKKGLETSKKAEDPLSGMNHLQLMRMASAHFAFYKDRKKIYLRMQELRGLSPMKTKLRFGHSEGYIRLMYLNDELYREQSSDQEGYFIFNEFEKIPTNHELIEENKFYYKKILENYNKVIGNYDLNEDKLYVKLDMLIFQSEDHFGIERNYDEILKDRETLFENAFKGIYSYHLNLNIPYSYSQIAFNFKNYNDQFKFLDNLEFILNNNKPENEGDEKSNIWFKCNIPAEKAKAYLEMKKEENAIDEYTKSINFSKTLRNFENKSQRIYLRKHIENLEQRSKLYNNMQRNELAQKDLDEIERLKSINE